MFDKIKGPLLYGLSVFAVYAILTYVLRVFLSSTSTDAEYFGIYSKNDLLIGVLVAIVLTFSHFGKKRMMK